MQSGIPVRFRSVPVLFRSVYGRLSAAVPVVVDKEPSQAGKPAAADRAALYLLVAYLFLALRGGLEQVGYMLRSFHIPVEAFPVESVVEQAA